MTNLTKGQQRRRLWDELLRAILEDAPEEDIVCLAGEYASSGDSVAAYQTNIEDALRKAKQKSQNHLLYYQCGRPILVKKDSILGKQIRFGNKKKKDEKTNDKK